MADIILKYKGDMRLENILKSDPSPAHRYLLELGQVSVVLLDSGMNVLDCNQQFVDMLGLASKPSGVCIRDYISGLGQPGAGSFTTGDVAFVTGSDGRLTMRTHITAHGDGYLMFAQSPASDEAASLRAELEKAHAELGRIRNTDPLTGLANVESFMESLRKAVSLARRGEMPLSLVICDIDNFKFVTDTYGRETADNVLVAFAKIMDDNTREEDTPARFRGDEFSLLLPNTVSAHAVYCADRMWQNVKDLHVDGVRAKLSASFGITELADEDTVESFIERAESAVFRAKTAYPKNVTVV